MNRAKPLLVVRAFPFEPWTVLAPMEGVTHPLLRDLMAEQGGLGLVTTEFVRISDQNQSRRFLRTVVRKSPGLPLCVQVMGRSKERLQQAAVLVQEAGADIIDLNLGCPSPKAARGGVGAAMLKDRALLFDVVSGLREVVEVPLSAKMRAGYDDASGAVAIAKTLEDAGVDWISVHPRRRVDHYLGVADWRITRALASACSVPIIGNGDCWYAADALRMREETGCEGVMIGRPALRNPWVFQQIGDLLSGRPPTAPDGAMVVEWLERYCQRCPNYFRDVPLGKLKELIRYVGRAVRDDRTFLNAALRVDSSDALLELAHASLGNLRSEELDLDAFGVDRLERAGGLNASRDDAPAPDQSGVASAA